MVVAKSFGRALGAVVLGVTASLWTAVASAAANDAGTTTAEAPISYASVSDQELTNIAARWDDLNAQQRRALLSEVTTRMKRGNSAQGVPGVKVRRRYGTVVRDANRGRATLHIHVRSVRKGGQDFGVGFEHRAQQEDAAPEEAESNGPVIRVADPE